jgi:hypothetical protein
MIEGENPNPANGVSPEHQNHSRITRPSIFLFVLLTSGRVDRASELVMPPLQIHTFTVTSPSPHCHSTQWLGSERELRAAEEGPFTPGSREPNRSTQQRETANWTDVTTPVLTHQRIAREVRVKRARRQMVTAKEQNTVNREPDQNSRVRTSSHKARWRRQQPAAATRPAPRPSLSK